MPPALVPTKAGSVLGNLSLRPKIALILLLPVAVSKLLAGLRIGSSVSTSRQAAEVRGLTEFALRGTALAHELQGERGLTLGRLLGDRTPDRLRAQRAATNRALAAYRASAAGLTPARSPWPPPRSWPRPPTGWGGWATCAEHRQPGSVSAAAALEFYNTTIADLLNTNRGLASGDRRPAARPAAGAFVAMSRSRSWAILEREQVSGVLDRGRFAPGEFRRFTSTLATRAVLLSEFRPAPTTPSGPCSSTPWSVPRSSGPGSSRRRSSPARAPRLEVDPAEWWTVNSTEIGLLRQVEEGLGAAAVDATRADEVAARTRAGIDAVAVLLVLALAIGLSLVVVRSSLRPLGLLRSSAEEVANNQLPGVVERLHRRAGRPQRRDPSPSASATATRSARWSGPSTRSTDRGAGRGRAGGPAPQRGRHVPQPRAASPGAGPPAAGAAGRAGAHRGRPQQLRSLFQLDHLATRMRRNAENLLVLSGAEPVRRWSDPVPSPW